MKAFSHPSLLALLASGTFAASGILLAADRAPMAADPAALGIVLGDQVTSADPFLGDWEAAPDQPQPKPIVAQVMPRGSGAYRINFLPAFDQRCPPYAEIDAKAEGNVLRFNQSGWLGSIRDGVLEGTGQLQEKVGSPVFKATPLLLKKTVRLSPRLGASPPEGAIRLYDGKNLLEQFESDGRDGNTLQWQQLDDCLRVWPPLSEHAFGAALRTRQPFPNFQLHIEFRLPLIAAALGQTRANSGVIIEDFEFYEVQILDSYGLPGYWDETGALYTKEAPRVNACRPPGLWQSYDIEFHGPKFDGAGKLASPARISVNLNGVQVQRDLELPYSERALQTRREKPAFRTPGRITFQNHGDPIDYRNLWIKPLKDE